MDILNMQADEVGSKSGVTDVNSLHSAFVSLPYPDSLPRQSHHIMAGFPLPFTAEVSNNLVYGPAASNRGNMATSDEMWNVQDHPNLITNGVHFSGASDLAATLDSCSWMDQYPKKSVSFETMNLGFEALPFMAAAGFTKFMMTPEFLVRNGTDHPLNNEWLHGGNGMNSTDPGTTGLRNELSLSLSTSHHSRGASSQEHCSELNSSGRRGHVGSEQTSCSSSSNLSLSFNSYKPLSPMMSGSRFFQAMQDILADIACYALANHPFPTVIENRAHESCSLSTRLAGKEHTSVNQSDGIEGFVFQNNFSRKKNLLALLQVIDEQYNQCLDEVHTVVSAFHAVTQLDPGLHARFALPTISSMYKNLRERISSHILETGVHLDEGEAEAARQEKPFEPSFEQKQWAPSLQQLSKRDPQLWRPQRGLPERSVSVLRAWMFQNFLHPYPKDSEKHILALKSGLTRSQVSNWFINARVRLWKPMIEEMYAEMNRRKSRQNDEETGRSSLSSLLEDRRFTVD